jgi:hypothetical protein
VLPLGEKRVDYKSAWTALQDKLFLGSDRAWVVGAEREAKIDDSALVLMTEEGIYSKGLGQVVIRS